MSEWISVEDRFPELREVYKGSPLESCTVLIFTGNWVTIGSYKETYKKRHRRWIDSTQRGVNVTHWMPLPDPPERTK